MAETEILKCIGCGAPLQSEDSDAPGYVPESSLYKEDVICKRCFRLKNYNEVHKFFKFTYWLSRQKRYCCKCCGCF